ncbi:hypothetical protein EVAR_48492_1 [Eumeta japonica]|uniref:Uncharacterized protein n=1 Tax=Eumeta variegata TaxID=151549 RepID=A0A4C1XJ40_EUMVA|nr:hypothetical protein EVAR_48492_1 [Eumeta japonica]
MIGHGTLIIASVYLSPTEKLLRSDLESLFSPGDAFILFGGFNSKDRFNNLSLFTPTPFPDNYQHGPKILDVLLVKGVVLNIVDMTLFFGLILDAKLPWNSHITRLAKSKDNHSLEKVSVAFEKIDTPALSDIQNDILSTNEMEHAIEDFTNDVGETTHNHKSDRRILVHQELSSS